MAELVHRYIGGDLDLHPPYTVETQSHMRDITHAAVLSEEGVRVALFKGESWEDARNAAQQFADELNQGLQQPFGSA